MSLIDEIKAGLERQRDELAKEYRDNLLDRAFARGADSRTEIILELVSALERFSFKFAGKGTIETLDNEATSALTSLKQRLGV